LAGETQVYPKKSRTQFWGYFAIGQRDFVQAIHGVTITNDIVAIA
jgi:hypothetical protein